VLLGGRRVQRWPTVASAAILTGGSLGVAVLWLVEVGLNLIGSPLDWTTRAGVVAGFAMPALAAANLYKSSWRRKVGAGLAAVAMLTGTAVLINAHYGLNPTPASLLGADIAAPVALPTLIAPPGSRTSSSSDPTKASSRTKTSGSLWRNWQPPTDLPPRGTTGTATIPGTVSGFTARPAGVYLPPAALTAHPPELPLLVMMMGQPGNPDPSFIADTLDRLASTHHGLAPIVIVADQIGNPATDTLCLDTHEFGKVDTYINTDVVAWARAHPNILNDRAHWTVAGYSHGGQCAISFGAKHPDLWGNILDISGEEYPGAEHAATTRQQVFGGDQSAYNAQKPVSILGRNTYHDSTAIFTICTDDPGFQPGVRRVANAAAAAGMSVSYRELPRCGHAAGALKAGLDDGLALIYPRLGLSSGP